MKRRDRSTVELHAPTHGLLPLQCYFRDITRTDRDIPAVT